MVAGKEALVNFYHICLFISILFIQDPIYNFQYFNLKNILELHLFNNMDFDRTVKSNEFVNPVLP